MLRTGRTDTQFNHKVMTHSHKLNHC